MKTRNGRWIIWFNKFTGRFTQTRRCHYYAGELWTMKRYATKSGFVWKRPNEIFSTVTANED